MTPRNRPTESDPAAPDYPAYNPAPPQEGFDPRRHLVTLWSRGWMIVAVTAAFLALGAMWLHRAEAVYSSTATIKYESNRRQLVDVAGLEDGGTLANELATQVEVIRSPRTIRRVIDALGLERAEGRTLTEPASLSPMERLTSVARDLKNRLSRRLVSFEVEPLDAQTAHAQRLGDSIASRLRVSHVFGTKLITISFSDGNRDMAARVVNEFANQYILSLAEEHRRMLEEAGEWFTGQVADAEARLLRAEEALHRYKGAADIRVLEQNYEIATETMRELGREIERQKTALARLTARNRAAEDRSLWPSLLSDIPEYEALRERIEELEFAQVARIAEDTERHPEVRRHQRELDLLRERLTERTEQLIGDFRTEENLLALQLQSLEERRAGQEALVEEIQQAMIEYRVLEREVESAQELHSTLLARSMQVSVGADANASTVTVLSPGAVAEYPSSPRIMQTIVLFGLVGFFLGAGIVLAVERLDRSVKDPALVEERFGLPTLAMVPFLRSAGRGILRGGRKQGHSPLVAQSDPKSHQAEAFRLLRTSLQYSTPGHPPKVLLFTSSHPREGKSTIAANLAISHAQRGDRVLLIDGDLKLPVVHRTFDLRQEPGLSDVLTGQEEAEGAVVTTEVDNLFVLTAGHETPSPGDLLESENMAELLGRLREQYDVVILDSPPVTGIADALILSRAVDGICLVVDRGRTPLEALGKALSMLEQVRAPLLGVVYNNRTRGSLGPQASSYYGYGYGYGARKRTSG